jgi:hypothetical protein
MIYAYRDIGKWTIASLMPRFKGIGGWHTLTDAERAKHGWYPCVEVNAAYNPTTQIRSLAEFVLEDGIVTATYTIWDKPETQIYSEAATAVRDERNRLLSETDWMALSDNTMIDEWASYRQVLRDITFQEGFPFAVEWPTKPGE